METVTTTTTTAITMTATMTTATTAPPTTATTTTKQSLTSLAKRFAKIHSRNLARKSRPFIVADYFCCLCSSLWPTMLMKVRGD